VPANKKKSLGKLPTEVRNKMGYMMDSSHSFKSNVANNMKTMYMGSVYYQTDPNGDDLEKGEIVDTGDTLKEVTGVNEDEKIETVITKKKVPGKVIGGGYEDKMDDESWKKYLASETPEQKEARIKREIADGVREPDQEIEVKKDKVVKTKTPELGDIAQTFDATGNFGRRQQMRGAISQERKQKRYAVRQAKAQANIDGLKGKDKRKAIRDARNQAKLIQNKNLVARGNEIARQTQMQEQQGIVGPRQGAIKQNYTSSVVDSGTGRDTRQYSQQKNKAQAPKNNKGKSKGISKEAFKSATSGFFMDLPPKAMKHFNRKIKK